MRQLGLILLSLLILQVCSNKNVQLSLSESVMVQIKNELIKKIVLSLQGKVIGEIQRTIGPKQLVTQVNISQIKISKVDITQENTLLRVNHDIIEFSSSRVGLEIQANNISMVSKLFKKESMNFSFQTEDVSFSSELTPYIYNKSNISLNVQQPFVNITRIKCKLEGKDDPVQTTIRWFWSGFEKELYGPISKMISAQLKDTLEKSINPVLAGIPKEIKIPNTDLKMKLNFEEIQSNNGWLYLALQTNITNNASKIYGNGQLQSKQRSSQLTDDFVLEFNDYVINDLLYSSLSSKPFKVPSIRDIAKNNTKILSQLNSSKLAVAIPEIQTLQEYQPNQDIDIHCTLAQPLPYLKLTDSKYEITTSVSCPVYYVGKNNSLLTIQLQVALEIQALFKNNKVSGEIAGFNIANFGIVELKDFNRESFADLLELILSLAIPQINKSLKDKEFGLPKQISDFFKDFSVQAQNGYLKASGQINWKKLFNVDKEQEEQEVKKRGENKLLLPNRKIYRYQDMFM